MKIKMKIWMLLERETCSIFEGVGKVFKMTKCDFYRWEYVAGMGVRPHTPVCGHTLKCVAVHSMCWSVWPGFDSYTSS